MYQSLLPLVIELLIPHDHVWLLSWKRIAPWSLYFS
jgi:hypothetical protein